MPFIVDLIIKINREVFLNLYRKLLNLWNITIVFFEQSIGKDVMLMDFGQLFLVCILKKDVNLYRLLLRNDVI